MPALGPSLGFFSQEDGGFCPWPFISPLLCGNSSHKPQLVFLPVVPSPCSGQVGQDRSGEGLRAPTPDPRRYLTPQEIVEALGGLTFRPCSCAGPSLTYFPMWKLIPLLEGNPVRIHLSCTGFLFLPLQNRGKEGKLAECDTFLYNLAPAGHSLEVPSLF